MYADKDCYHGYNGTDAHDYSTFLYESKAIRIIEEHDFTASLMFMYAAQAPHDPFTDYHMFHNGIPSTCTDRVSGFLVSSVK